MRLTIDEVLKATGGRLAAPGSRRPDAVISGVSTDTRHLRPGDLYVPLRGPQADGHDFIADALRKGASASLASRAVGGLPEGAAIIEVEDGLAALARLARYYRRSLPVTVVGITGSVGKTTATAMCAAVLATAFRVARTRDDWNAEIGVPLTLLGLTPEHQVAVVEMGMRGLGQIAELVDVAAPEIGVVTTVGESHLELLRTIDNVARAKGELVAGLPPQGAAILNADDPRVVGLAKLSRARVVTYGVDHQADVQGTEIAFTEQGMRFDVQWDRRRHTVELPGWGRHNVRNALAAAAVGVTMGLDLDRVARGLAAFSPPKMRLQPVRAGDVLIINDAYNASPTSMDAAFEVLDALGRGRRTVAVLGEMKELGAASVQMHRDVGRSLARRPVSLLVVVETGGAQIADGAVSAGMAAEAIVRAASVEEAAHLVTQLIRPGDVVLVKGSRALAMERIVDSAVRARGAAPGARPS